MSNFELTLIEIRTPAQKIDTLRSSTAIAHRQRRVKQISDLSGLMVPDLTKMALQKNTSNSTTLPAQEQNKKHAILQLRRIKRKLLLSMVFEKDMEQKNILLPTPPKLYLAVKARNVRVAYTPAPSLPIQVLQRTNTKASDRGGLVALRSFSETSQNTNGHAKAA